MSFPSLFSTIKFAHLRPSASSSLAFARSISTSSASLSLFFGSSSPFPSSSSSPSPASPPPRVLCALARQPPSSSRSYHFSPIPTFSPSSRPSLARLSSTSPPSSPPPRSPTPPPPSPPRHKPPPSSKPKPWIQTPKAVVKRTVSRFDRMRELQKKQRELKTESLGVWNLPADERKELKELEERLQSQRCAASDADLAELNKFEPMDGSSSNPELLRWWKEIGTKKLNDRSVWREFLEIEDRPFFGTSKENALRFSRSHGLLDIPVTIAVLLAGTFTLYYLAAFFTNRETSRAESFGTSPSLLRPWVGWFFVTSIISIACILPHLVKGSPARILARKGRKPTSWWDRSARSFDERVERTFHPEAMDILRWDPLRGSHLGLWTASFSHLDGWHCYGNLAFFAIYGLFAYSYFDSLSWFSHDGWIWPYFRQIPGWLNENWTVSDPVASERRASTGVFHFFVFCMAAGASGRVVLSIRFFLRAPKTLLRTLQDPSKIRSKIHPWYFDPRNNRIFLGSTIKNEIRARGALGISNSVAALESLALLTITFNSWNPSLLLVQGILAQSLKDEFTTVYRNESKAGEFGHFPGLLFGFIYFFVGTTTWDWFLDTEKDCRLWSKSVYRNLVEFWEARFADDKEEEEESSPPLVEDTGSDESSAPSPSPAPDPLSPSLSEEIVVVESNSPPSSPPEPVKEPTKRRGWSWWSS